MYICIYVYMHICMCIYIYKYKQKEIIKEYIYICSQGFDKEFFGLLYDFPTGPVVALWVWGIRY